MDETSDRRVLDDAAAVVAAPWELLRATGGDRVVFLHRLLTANVAGVPVGGGCHALLLDLKAHPQSELYVFVGQDEVRLVVPPAQAAPTATALGRYAIMDDVTLVPEPGIRCVALLGPEGPGRLAASGVPLPAGFLSRPALAHAEVASPWGPIWAVRVRSHGAGGVWLWLPAAAVPALEGALAGQGIPRLSDAAGEAARIAAGEPRWGSEIKGDVFPMEVGLSGAIDYGKGCFLGQEPIVRIRDRGHINWRLVGLRLAGPDVPAPGDPLESDPRPKAGRVTSAARDGAGAVALALLHTSLPVGAEVRVRHGDRVLPARVVEAGAESEAAPPDDTRP